VRVFLLIEAVAFVAAALVHAGWLARGYAHREAAIAESVIAGVLVLGLLVSLIAAGWSRAAGLAAQGFALLGTFVGIFTIIVGIGPQSGFDGALHTGLVALLASGLAVVVKRGREPGVRQVDYRHPHSTIE
jgi:hypothetical protein